MDQLTRMLIALTDMNQGELAEALGVDRSAIWRWEKGERVMNAETFVNLIKIVAEETPPHEIVSLIINTEI